MNPQRRARVMFAWKALIEAHMDELAQLLSSEHGKVIADSKGDIQRGLEVVEFACGIPHLLKGDYTDGAGPGIDVYSMRQPLGVCAGITPFNFPAMIPLWMSAVALACGNAFILKPSEKDPSVPVRLAELALEAGLPEGVLQVVHGDKIAVDVLLTHDLVKAVSFVGSSDIGSYVYATGAAHGKGRIQAMAGGAKNHGIIMPDADLDQRGQGHRRRGLRLGRRARCMALPVAVPGRRQDGRRLCRTHDRRRPCAQAVGGLDRPRRALWSGGVGGAQVKASNPTSRCGVDEGAKLLLDGRGLKLQGHEEGFFIGPTLFDHVKPSMKTYQDEIFGPVLQVVRAETLEEAAALASNHAYGNGVAIFTRNGLAAREFAQKVNVGMVGINVPIPVPVAYHSFGGWKRSAFGDMNQYGEDGVRFYTKVKTVTQRWPDGDFGDQAFIIPTMR